MSSITKKLFEKNVWNDELLNTLISSLENKEWKDTIQLNLKYKDVLSIIKDLIVENVHVDLCEDTLKKGLEQRKLDRKRL